MRYRALVLVVALSLVGLIPLPFGEPVAKYGDGILSVGVREAWAGHCNLLSGGAAATLSDLTSRPNNELSCTTVNSRSDGKTVFPGFSPFSLFKAASGSQGTTNPGTANEFFSVTMASFVNLNPGDVTGNMFGDIILFSTVFANAPNVGPFATDNALQSISVPCGTGTGDGVPSNGAAGECPNSSNEANTSGLFTINPAMTITSLTALTSVGRFEQQMNNIATGFGASGDNTEGFVFNSRTARLFDFGSGAAVACTITGTLRSTCVRQGFTQFAGGALFSSDEAGNDADRTTGSRVTIEAAFAVTTLASGLHASGATTTNSRDFRIAFHQLISQGDFQMNTLGSFKANSPAFMPAASYPTGLSLSSSSNFLLSQVNVPTFGAGGVIFLTRTPGAGVGAPGTALNSNYSQVYTPSHCLPGFLTSTQISPDVRSAAFNAAFLFRGAFNDFACPAPP